MTKVPYVSLAVAAFLALILASALWPEKKIIGPSPQETQVAIREDVPQTKNETAEGARLEGGTGEILPEGVHSKMQDEKVLAGKGAQLLERAKSKLSAVEGQVHSQPALFFEQAKRGQEGVAVAAFGAVASSNPSWVDFLNEKDLDASLAKVEAMKWLDRAATNGDVLAGLRFGMQAFPILRFAKLSVEQREWIELRARTHLVNLFELRVPGAANALATGLFEGSLGKQSIVLAHTVAEINADRGGYGDDMGTLAGAIQARATLADKQETQRIMRSANTFAELRAMILKRWVGRNRPSEQKLRDGRAM